MHHGYKLTLGSEITFCGEARVGNRKRTKAISFSAGTSQSNFVSLQTASSQLVLDVSQGHRPSILYWGKALKQTTPEELAALSVRQWAHGGPEIDIGASLSNELGAGMAGPSGFIAGRQGADWATIFTVTDVHQENDSSLRIICEDANTQIRAIYELSLCPETHVLEATTRIENLSQCPVTIDWCAALCVPLNRRLTRLMGFTGRWASEFQLQEIPAFRGSYVRENKSGRTSHDNFPGLIAMANDASEKSGSASGFHLGWSGNSCVRVDRHTDGRSFAQMGELFFPSEMELAEGESYTSPTLFAAWSSNGLNELSQQFQNHLLHKVMDGRAKACRRPVHYNTWEAVYFDHSEQILMALAEKAAAVGAERFVLDDGWFGSRRSDASGLGDWYVSTDVYPNGLAPLAKKVRELGMEFGIWFEPEMVNPDSDLYRAHPDWILEAAGVAQVPSRQQYTLDLTRKEVSDYLFDRMSAIIHDLNVAYIKWDMNRDIHHPGSAGRGAIHRQTHAVYALMRRLRDEHPSLEIESCASGGARTDYGVLSHTDRIWTSDNNDAHDRQRIQRGASYFFPLSVMGAHVGPKRCHITGRTFTMAYRAATAFFGHMGMELNLLDESPEDLSILQDAIALYKRHRNLLHNGDFYRLDSSDYLNMIGVVAKDKSEALFSCAKISEHKSILPGRFRFAGLDPAKRYRMRLIWPQGTISVTSPSIVDTAQLGAAGRVFSGEALLEHGAQLPLMHPDTCLIYHFAAE